MSTHAARPTVRQLEYFVALARDLNFRVAAEACYVTQPALSAQIRQLERRLGCGLFERDRRSVSLTQDGQRLLPHAQEALLAVDTLAEAAGRQEAPMTGTLRIGVIPTVAPYVLPAAVPALRRRYPRLRLLLREDQTARLVDRLRRGELDVLLLALEVDLGGAEALPLYRDPFVVAVPEGHPFAGRKTIRAQDLTEVEVLLLEDGHCLRDHALEICDLGRARELGDFRASSLNTLVRMVAGGVAVTLLPAMAVATEVRSRDRIRTIPLQKSAPQRTIGLAFRPSSARKAEFALLAEVLRARAPDGVVAAGG